jgi:hypothetical protein
MLSSMPSHHVPPADKALARLREALPALREEFGVVRIGLFGSIARGESRPDSDADVLVDLERPISYFALQRLEDAVSERLGCHVDLHTRAGLRDYVRASAERDLILA